MTRVEGAVGGIAGRAEERFARLRAEARTAAADGTTARRVGRLGQPAGGPAGGAGAVPSGWCVSTIARLAVNDPGALPEVAGAQAALRVAGPATLYPAESLHASMLGATQREPSADFALGRLRAIVAAVRETAAGVPAAAVHLGRLNLLGAQWFVEATPADETWAALRGALVAPFEGLGEVPIAYPDTEPIHLNVARLDRLDDPAAADALLAAPPDLDRWVTLRRIEVVVTDFLVTPATLRVLDTITLG